MPGISELWPDELQANSSCKPGELAWTLFFCRFSTVCTTASLGTAVSGCLPPIFRPDSLLQNRARIERDPFREDQQISLVLT